MHLWRVPQAASNAGLISSSDNGNRIDQFHHVQRVYASDFVSATTTAVLTPFPLYLDLRQHRRECQGQRHCRFFFFLENFKQAFSYRILLFSCLRFLIPNSKRLIVVPIQHVSYHSCLLKPLRTTTTNIPCSSSDEVKSIMESIYLVRL